MMEQLRRAEYDVKNENYEESKTKIDAVKSVMHKSKEMQSRDIEDSFDRDALYTPGRRPQNNREDT